MNISTTIIFIFNSILDCVASFFYIVIITVIAKVLLLMFFFFNVVIGCFKQYTLKLKDFLGYICWKVNVFNIPACLLCWHIQYILLSISSVHYDYQQVFSVSIKYYGAAPVCKQRIMVMSSFNSNKLCRFSKSIYISVKITVG